MTTTEAQNAVIEALSLGLTLKVRATRGDAVRVGRASLQRAKRRQDIVSEYFFAHTFGQYQSRDVAEIASMAIEHAGRKIGTLAQREVINFVLRTKNRLS